VIEGSALRTAIGEKSLGLFFREECHWAVPCRSGPRLVRSPALPDQTGDVEELADTRQESARWAELEKSGCWNKHRP
jgi:hypothetical protein